MTNEFELFVYSVYNVLGIGHENALTRRELCQRLKCGDRSLRRAIEILRQEYPILSLDDGKGYYLPPTTSEGRQEAARWTAKQEKRIRSIRAAQRGAKRFSSGSRGRKSGVPGQLSMFSAAGEGL